MIPVEERIAEISKQCAADLSTNFKTLSNEGKIEALIFNSLISLFNIQARTSEANYEAISQKVYHNLIKEVGPYKKGLSNDSIGKFIHKRFEAYSNEIEMIFEGLGYNILKNSSYYFYVNPLSERSADAPDMTQILNFTREIIKMSNNALEEFDQIKL